MEALGIECYLVELSKDDMPKAYVLIMKDAVTTILDNDTQMDMFNEQKDLQYDKKAFMYGRVVNKHARWNLCFDDNSRGPAYEEGKGRIVGYDEVPIMIRVSVESVFMGILNVEL